MNFRLPIYLIIISFLSCSKEENEAIINLNGGFIDVIGHGGGGFQSPFNKAPENSLSSITKAIEVYYAEGVELDVQLTKDSNLVLYHDDKLETSTSGNGFIYEYNLEELSQYKYDRGFYANILLDEYIITLKTILQKFSQRKIKPQLHLDLRHWLYNDNIYSSTEFHAVYIDEIVDVISQYQYQQYTYISSSEIDLLKDLHQKEPLIKLMIETNEISWGVEIINENNWFGIVAKNNGVLKKDIDFAHSQNVRVALFGVKIQSDIEDAVNKHPDFILTDNILKLQQILYN
jgi:glycerophosphoryl diester phosphodiesterase